MRNLTEGNVTQAVLQKIKADNPRLQAIMTSLIKHLDAFIRDLDMTI